MERLIAWSCALEARNGSSSLPETARRPENKAAADRQPREAKSMRRRSWAHAIREPTGFTTPSPRLVRGRLPTAFSLSPPRSGDVPSALETSGEAVAAFVFRFFLARVRAGSRHGSTGHHGSAPRRAGGEHAGQALKRVAGRRNQARNPRQQLHRRHHEVRRAVAPWLAEEVREAAVREE